MEARLTDIPTDPRMHIAPESLDTLTCGPVPAEALGGSPAATPSKDQPHSAVALRIDRYLQAAGAMDKARRSRITAAAARDLLARGASAEPGWAEVIAAVDRSLAAEFTNAEAPAAQGSARGRVALVLAERAMSSGDAARMGRDWGTPARRRLVMPAQDLTSWQPTLRPEMERHAARLRGLQVSRSVQGLAACLSLIAVLIIP
ncbi:hypothetical protein [Pelagibius sp. 7325]|uniref:hypothetical protein n=1 Tax=Pelagibius sp. 7325 TaxID=3131994 RepID=UPI0030EB78F9